MFIDKYSVSVRQDNHLYVRLCYIKKNRNDDVQEVPQSQNIA